MNWSSADVAAVLDARGFALARRESHDTYTKPGHPRTVSVPRNRASLPAGTLSSIWRQAGMTAPEALRMRRGDR